MNRGTIVFLTSGYLNFASNAVLQRVRERVRLVLLKYSNSDVPRVLAENVDQVYEVSGSLTENIRPVLNFQECIDILKREISRAGGAKNVRIFCQEESNVLGAAKLRDALGVPGDSATLVEVFRDKTLMKRRAAEHGIPIPKYELLDRDRISDEKARTEYYAELVQRLGQKLVIKPTSAAGSLNVSIINDYVDFRVAVEQVRTDRFSFEYEVDEFIGGVMYQCDSYVEEGTVRFCGALELLCTNFDFVQGTPLAVFPALDNETRLRLESFNSRVITAFGMQFGSTHHEMFIRGGMNDIVFLEIAARVPGGIGVPFHERNSGVNLIDLNLLATAGIDRPDVGSIRSGQNVVSALLPVKYGRIVSLNEPAIESKFDIAWSVKVGEVVQSRSLADNAGILTLCNSDAATLRRDYEALRHYVPVSVEMPSR